MRSIKFRGKSKKDGSWAYGFYVLAEVRHIGTCVQRPYIMHINGSGGMLYVSDRTLVLEDTVGQYTELKDKTGKEIYEGDIVECVSWNEFFSDGSGKPMESFRRKMVVKFYNGAFKMVEEFPELMEPSYWDLTYNGDVVIIGNIYDNPELLKKESED